MGRLATVHLQAQPVRYTETRDTPAVPSPLATPQVRQAPRGSRCGRNRRVQALLHRESDSAVVQCGLTPR